MGRLIDEAVRRMFGNLEGEFTKDKLRELIAAMRRLSGTMDDLKVTLEERGVQFNDPSSASVLRAVQFEMRQLHAPLALNAERIHALILEAQFYFHEVRRLVEAFARHPDPALAPRVLSHMTAAVAFGQKVESLAGQFLSADARRQNLLWRISSRLDDEEEIEYIESVIRSEGFAP